MKNIEEKYLDLALKEAYKAKEKDEVPVGCVLVKNGKIIAKAHNLKEHKQNALAHAEIIAINKACKKLQSWRLDELTMYVTLEPCPMCAGAILQSRIKKVVYGASDLKYGALGSDSNLFNKNSLNHYPEIIENIKEEECSFLLKDFFKTKRK